MPIRHVKGGYKWGSRGHVYKSRAGDAKQAAAAYAHGYRGDPGEHKSTRSKPKKGK